MKNMKKLLVLALVIVSVLAISVPALAASIDAVPGAKRTGSAVTFSAGSDVSASVSATLQSGDIIRIFLDVYNPERSTWVERDVIKFQSAGSNSGTLSYSLDSNETQARIRTYGYEANSGTISVTYTFD